MEPDADGSSARNFDLSSVTDLSQTCRTCACVDTYFIPLYDGEGIEHNLGAKINQYLPINVSEGDELPTHLCYQCASLLITWHEMFIGALKAEEDLGRLKSRLEDKKTTFGVDEARGQESDDDMQDSSISMQDQDTDGENSRPLLVSAQPIRIKAEASIIQSDDNDSQDFQAFIELSPEELPRYHPLSDVDIKFTKIEPLLLPDYPNFVVCDVCGECINTNETPMAKHHKTVHEVKPSKEPTKQLSKEPKVQSLSCVCEFCGKVFATQRHVTYHRRHVHCKTVKPATEESEKICEVCGAVLKSSKKLREHKRNNHIIVRNFPCIVCNMRFKLRETLINHQKNLHNVFVGEKYHPAFHRRKVYSCFLCNIELASKFSLRRHLLIKHEHKSEEKWSYKQRTFECDHCDRKFKNKISFLRHRDKVLNGQVEKRFKCSVCSRGFFCHTDYTRHFKTHKVASS